jgi:hypothetical protein
MRTHLRPAAVAGLVAATALLAACHTTTSSPPAAPTTTGGALSSAAPPAGGGSGGGTASTANIRVANFFAPQGQAGPGVDIYDVSLQGQAATPILTNVTYGTVSAYVQPHLLPNAGKEVILTALPTGEDPVAQKSDGTEIGGLIDDGSGAQATIVLTADGNDATGGPTSIIGLSDSMRMEKGDDGQGGKGPAAPAITDGSSEFLVDDTALPDNLNPSLFLMVDASCTPPINGDPNEPGLPLVFAAATSTIQSAFALFPTTPGAHQVSVVSWPDSAGPTCKQLTQLQSTTSVTTTANQQVALYIYGSTLDALHIAVAPIQP